MSINTKNSFPEQAIENGGLDLLPVLPGRSGLGAVKLLDVRRAGLKRLQPHPVLRADNGDLLEHTTKYVEAKAGEPFEPSDYLEYIGERGMKLSDTPANAVKATTLVAKWSHKLKNNLSKKGLDGQWLILKDGLTFAPNARDARIHALAEGIVKQQRQAPKFSAEDIRKSIWDVADVVEVSAEPTPVVLKPESELTRKEKKVLAYISELAVSQAAKYPSEEKLVATISEQAFMYPKEIKNIIGELVAQKFLFPGRSGGKPTVTTNENVALASLQPKRATKKAKVATPAERKIEESMAYKLIDVLLEAGAGNETKDETYDQTYTIQKIWAMLQAKNGIIVTRETPSFTEVAQIKEAAKALADQGILVAANFKVQSKDPARTAVHDIFKIGLSPEVVENLAELDPVDHTDHVKQLVA